MSSSAIQVAKTATYLPDLVEVQRASFKWFLDQGLIEELESFSPITDYTGKLELHFIGSEYRLKRPRHDVEEAKRRDATFASQMYVTCRLVNKETGEIKEQEVFIGELPLMTERGTFIINGAERVIVNQIVRSPGVYFKDEMDKNGRRTYNASVIPNRGAWLKFETDKNDLLHVRVDKTRKINAHVLSVPWVCLTTTCSTSCVTPSSTRSRLMPPTTRASVRKTKRCLSSTRNSVRVNPPQ